MLRLTLKTSGLCFFLIAASVVDGADTEMSEVSKETVKQRIADAIPLQRYDANHDFVVTPVEEENHRYLAGREFERFVRKHGDKNSYSVAEVRKHFGVTIEEKKKFESKILIRSDFNDVLPEEDLTSKDQKATRKKLTGALFSYARDIQNNQDTWSAKGAVIIPLQWHTFEPYTRESGAWTKYGLIPSISFDRVTNNKDESKEVDSLIFRVGAFAEYGGGAFTDYQQLRVFASYGTDFDFRSRTPAAEFEWEPVKSFGQVFGIGMIRPVKDDVFAYRLRTFLHAEYGEVQEAGDKAGVKEEVFFRAGPVIELTLDPFFTELFACTISYSYYFPFSGPRDRNYNFKVEPQLFLDEAKHFTLKASYERGGLDLTKEFVNTFSVGIGVLF